MILTPGAQMSGRLMPSRVGPNEEKAPTRTGADASTAPTLMTERAVPGTLSVISSVSCVTNAVSGLSCRSIQAWMSPSARTCAASTTSVHSSGSLRCE